MTEKSGTGRHEMDCPRIENRCVATWVISTRQISPTARSRSTNSFQKIEIHRIDSNFIEDPKNIIFSQRSPNFGGGTALKWAIRGTNIYRLCQEKLPTLSKITHLQHGFDSIQTNSSRKY